MRSDLRLEFRSFVKIMIYSMSYFLQPSFAPLFLSLFSSYSLNS